MLWPWSLQSGSVCLQSILARRQVWQWCVHDCWHHVLGSRNLPRWSMRLHRTLARSECNFDAATQFFFEMLTINFWYMENILAVFLRGAILWSQGLQQPRCMRSCEGGVQLLLGIHRHRLQYSWVHFSHGQHEIGIDLNTHIFVKTGSTSGSTPISPP